MLPIKITIGTHNFPSKRSFSRASTIAHREMGDHWHKHMLPWHFQSFAPAKYGYRPRKKGYRTRDQQKGGRLSQVELLVNRGRAIPDALTHPLVVTGNLRRAVLSLSNVRGFPTRATIQFNAPVYVPLRQRTSKQPPIADELMRVTPSEREALSKVFAKAMEREQKRAGETTKKTIS